MKIIPTSLIHVKSSKWQVVFRLLPAAFLLLISFVIHAHISYVIHAQNPQIIVSNSAFSLLNKKDNSFIVIDDSSHYWRINANGTEWEKRNLYFRSSEIVFANFLNDYTPVGLDNGRILFCHHGVGTVYELRNDTILRIDRSFNHRNQYHSSIFGHDNSLYAFGGYGLFETKNLFVCYSNVLNEWRQVISNCAIEPRTSHDYMVTDDALYVFGGFNKIDADAHQEYKDCWKYQFLSREWVKLGRVNIEYDSHIESEDNSQSQLLFQTPYILRINIEDNLVKRYADRDINVQSHGQFDTSQNKILLSEYVDKMKVFSVHNTNEILHTFLNEIPFYTPESRYTIYFYFAAVFFVLGAIYLGYRNRKRKKIRSKFKNSQQIIGDNGLFYIKNKPLIEYFDGHALTLLTTFLERPDEYISLQELDDLCNLDKKASSVSVKKRREHALIIIKEKLSISLDVDPKSVLIEEREAKDKRIKKIKLNDRELLLLNK